MRISTYWTTSLSCTTSFLLVASTSEIEITIPLLAQYIYSNISTFPNAKIEACNSSSVPVEGSGCSGKEFHHTYVCFQVVMWSITFFLVLEKLQAHETCQPCLRVTGASAVPLISLRFKTLGWHCICSEYTCRLPLGTKFVRPSLDLDGARL